MQVNIFLHGVDRRLFFWFHENAMLSTNTQQLQLNEIHSSYSDN